MGSLVSPHHRIGHLLGQDKGSSAILTGHAGLNAGSDGVDEVGQLPVQGLFGGHVELPALDARLSPLLLHEAPRLDLLRGVVDRDVGIPLEEPHFAYAVAADAARP